MTAPRDLAERRKLLGIYLNDHLMGATAGVEVARRCLRSNAGSALAGPLAELVGELADDRATLLEMMASLRIPVSRPKVVTALVSERLARLKPNGRLLTYSPLSRLVELEGLHAGVLTKAALWRSLRRLSAPERTFGGADLNRLLDRAESQLQRLERLRLDAAAEALPSPRSRAAATVP